MTLRTIVAPALFLLAAVPLRAADPSTLTIWPGYTIELPAGYCVQLSNGPDFHVLYFREKIAPKGAILVGVYAGHAPRKPECAKSTTRRWEANELAFQSARGSDGCAEFLVQDRKKPERGYLHIWFGPGAKDRLPQAESVASSVRPAPIPGFTPTDLPTCP